ncbi:MAG: hypothetical protein JO307_10630 [Bryobacterales bacterium]|nr:hypothetical protein [Bryobacterales bacterium]MBV9398456.1 hypothetical protein [Bryobacterales bacterium]
MKFIKYFSTRPATAAGFFASLLLVTRFADANPISIINETFADSNTVVSVMCYNGGGSVGPNGLNCNPPGFVWDHNPNATVTGNMDTTGTATSVFEQMNLSAPLGESALAQSAADLSAGTARSLTSGSSGAEGVSMITMQDNVHFSVAGAGATTVTPITVTWSFDGSLTGPFLGFSGTPVEAQSQLQLGGSVSASEDIFGGPPTLTGINQSGWVSGNFTSATPALVQFSGVYDLVGSSTTLPFLLSLSTFASNGDTADFSHTSQVGLILPSNVTFTSDSGAFLTGTSASTPEPSSWIFFVTACAAVAMVRYRRKFMVR